MDSRPLKGLVFCTTGLDQEARAIVQKRVVQLGGSFSAHLTRQVTHLIVGCVVNSAKYQAAKRANIATILPTFVEDVFRHHMLSMSTDKAAPFDLEAAVRRCTVPVFYGCRISITGGSDASGRETVASIVHANGGHFSFDMDQECTHLLVVEPVELETVRSSPKVYHAIKFGINMMRLSWLFDSVKADRLLDGQETDSTGRSYVFEVPGVAQGGLQELVPTQSFLYGDLSVNDVQQASIPLYFEHLHFYICDGVSSEQLALLKKLVLVAGGTRHSETSSMITHIVVHHQTLDEETLRVLQSFCSMNVQPTVVHDQWLFACFFQKRLVDVTPFEAPQAFQYSQEAAAVKSSTDSIASGKKKDAAISNRVVGHAGTLWAANSCADQSKPIRKNSLLDTALSQRAIPLVADSTNSNSGEPAAKVHSYARVKLETLSHCDREQVLKNSTLPLFSRVSVGVHQKHFRNQSIAHAEVVDLLQQHGGLVDVAGTTLLDYVICPMIVSASVVGSNYRNAIWVEQCIKEKSIIQSSSRSDVCYVPVLTSVSQNRQTTILKGLVFAVTGFSGVQREFLSRLIVAAGGGYTETLSKHNTHLVCLERHNATSAKRQFAQSHGITMVSKQWVMECITAGRLLALADDHHKSLLENSSNQHQVLDGQSVLMKERKRLKEQPPPIRRVLSMQTESQENSDRDEDIASIVADQKPLNGCVLVPSPRVWHRRNELQQLAIALGAVFLWSYDASRCTHYIHQGNVKEEAFREFKLVRKTQTISIVSPQWLEECSKRNRRLDERLYPHFDANTANFTPSISVATSAESLKASAVDAPVELTEAANATIDFDAVIAADKAHSNVKRSRVTYDISHKLTPLDDPTATPLPAMVLACSGIDAAERASLKSLVERLNDPCTVQFTNESRGMTHLITKQLILNEKVLAALAASKVWILKPSYLQAVFKLQLESDGNQWLGASVNEIDHEWTVDGNNSSDASADTSLTRLPRAWRLSATAAFENWIVLLMCDQSRVGWVSSILMSGKAKVVVYEEGMYASSSISSPSSLSSSMTEQHIPLLQFTHVLCSSTMNRTRLLRTSPFSSLNPDIFHMLDIISQTIQAILV